MDPRQLSRAELTRSAGPEPPQANARYSREIDMERNWVAGAEDVKCFADKDESGTWKGRVLVGSGKDAQRVERFLDCDGVSATEEEAVMAATAWAQARMPEQADT
jgi:hypothetical protein